MLLTISYSLSNVVVLHSDLVKGATVVAWVINFLARVVCSVRAVVVAVLIRSTHRPMLTMIWKTMCKMYTL